MDTRVKLLVKSENLSYDEAVHLLQVCNWDVGKAQAVIAQRKLLQSPSGHNAEAQCPLVVPAQGTSDPAAVSVQTNSSYGADSVQSLPKSADMSKNPDETPGLRLSRGMSNAFINSKIVTAARGFLLKEAEAAMVAERGGDDDDDGNSFVQTTGFTFMLPDLSIFPEDLKAFLYKDLVDSATLVSLEQAGHLNWWADFGACQRLLPLVTSGDGNCLLHAASLGMWGFHDRQLTLRKLLHDALTNGASAESFKRRWRCQQSSVYRQCSLVLSEDEWNGDWSYLLQLSSAQPRSVGTKQQRGSIPRLERSVAGQSLDEGLVYLESLEEIHVFVLSHILRRPIIVIAKTVLENVDGDALAPIPFGGIYLPLEWDPAQCHSDPLLLTYNLSHFSALVTMEVSSTNQESHAYPPTAIPLVNPQLGFLPFHFATDPGPNYEFSRNLNFSLSHNEKLNLLQRYLNVEQIPIPHFQRELDSYPEDLGTAGKTEQLVDHEEIGAKERNCGEDLDKKTISKQKKFIKKPFEAVGSKLKNISKTNKVGNLGRRGSIGVATQSTRVSSVAAETLEHHSFIISAKLHPRKTKYQDEMTRNYIESVREKFIAQQIKRREQNVEIRRRSIERLNLRQSVAFGKPKLPTDATEEHHGTKDSDSASEGVPRRMNAITRRGISDRQTVDGNYLKTVSKPSAQCMADALTNSHSPPNSKNSSSPSGVFINEMKQNSDVSETVQQLCRAGNCPFYGSLETGMFCSQCFKSGKQQQQQLCDAVNCRNKAEPTLDNLCRPCFDAQHKTAQTKF